MSDLKDSPLIQFEDEHLLVVNKPAGWNTHSPAPFAGEGVYDWLRHREPRWATLAIMHRLDKETSGLLVFSKSTLANRSLTQQFAGKKVRKRYVLATDRPVPRKPFTVKSALVRVGDKYASRPLHAGAEIAETHFRVLRPAARSLSPLMAPSFQQTAEPGTAADDAWTLVEAEPVTGRTHQIRAHAATSGFPICGDVLYGGRPAARLCLHAAELQFLHPATGEQMRFVAAWPDLRHEPWLELRAAVISPERTNTYRMIHGAADGWPGWHVDRHGDYLLSQSVQPLSPAQVHELQKVTTALSLQAVYHKALVRQGRRKSSEQGSPKLLFGRGASPEFIVRENGLQFALGYAEGYSVGLFLDQRDNRRRLLTNYVAAGFPLLQPEAAKPAMLNTFAYTCGFSVCAARAGLCVTSIDLSKNYLDWGKRNFLLNQVDPAAHDFIYGDVFDWLRRLANKGRSFDVVVLDPPTFSHAKECGNFQVERDYGRLIKSALRVLNPNGVLLACTNAASVKPENFLEKVKQAIGSSGRRIRQQHYAPQPPDFPITREEPAHLKTVWLRLA